MPNINVSLDINALRDFIKENPGSVFKGKKDYFSLTLYANDVPDNFGNDFSVKPRLSKQMKEEFIFVKLRKISQNFVTSNNYPVNF